MLRLYHGKILKVVSPRFTTLNWGREGDEVCSVNVHQLSNLVLKGCVQDCRHGKCLMLNLRMSLFPTLMEPKVSDLTYHHFNHCETTDSLYAE